MAKVHQSNNTIPPKFNTKDPWEYDFWLYKGCHLVECFFQKIKWFRRISTRWYFFIFCLSCFYHDFIEIALLLLFFKQTLSSYTLFNLNSMKKT